MDLIKAAVSKGVQYTIIDAVGEQRLGEMPAEVLDIEAHQSTPLLTLVRVKTTTGTRLYEVRVSEVRLCLSFTRGRWAVR